MDEAIKQMFSNDMVREAAFLYGVSPDQITFLGGFQNFIYQYQNVGREFILRFTPSSHRSKDVILAELEWINYLSQHGVSVSKPVLSAKRQLLHVIDGGALYFTVAAFEKASGRKIGYPECLTDTHLFEICGKITTEMHNLAKNFNPISTRHDWRDNYYLRNLATYVPASQSEVHRSCRELINEIDALPKNGDIYGLIHGDINVGNFHVSDNGITLFDFDECQYSWFMEDIAIQLYYLVYVYGDDSIDERTSQASQFMEFFMKGYTSVATIDEYWLRQIPLFLRLREIIVYIGMHRSWDLDNLEGWGKDFITQSKVRIERGIPIVESAFFEQL